MKTQFRFIDTNQWGSWFKENCEQAKKLKRPIRKANCGYRFIESFFDDIGSENVSV